MFYLDFSALQLGVFQLMLSSALFTLIWLVQLILYPTLSLLPESILKPVHQLHMNRISLLVIPLMSCEIMLIAYRWITHLGSDAFFMIQSALIGMVWISTFLIQVPLHNRIESQLSLKSDCQKLVHTNWLRTILWSLSLLVGVVHLWFIAS